MSIKYYVLGGPRYKPPCVSNGSPRLHVILMCMVMQLFVCCDRNKVQFNLTDQTTSILGKRQRYVSLTFEGAQNADLTL